MWDALCTEAERLLDPDDGIVADEPNILQAQPQYVETWARLMGHEWGLCVTNLWSERAMPGARSQK